MQNLDATGTPYTDKAATVSEIEEAISESRDVLKEVLEQQEGTDEDLASSAEESEGEVQEVLSS